MTWKISQRTFALRGLMAALFTTVLVYGCWFDRNATTESSPQPANLAALKLNPIQSCDVYKSYVAESLVNSYALKRGGVISGPPVILPTPSPQGVPDVASTTPDHVTGTNTQEAGVDEADIVKTDAQGNIYVAHAHYLRIEQGFPPKEMKELSRLDLGSADYFSYVGDFFLDEKTHRVVAFMQNNIFIGLPAAAGIAPMPMQRPSIDIVFIDVSDTAKPVITQRMTLEGYSLSNRRIDQRVHLVFSNNFDLPVGLLDNAEFQQLRSDYYQEQDEAAADAIRKKMSAMIRSAVVAANAEEFLPAVTLKSDLQTERRTLLGCSDVLSPQIVSHPELLIVASFDIDGANLSATAITAAGAVVYANDKHLYVTQYSGGWWGSAEQQPQTALHKFDIGGSAPKYLATGMVDGWATNAFNLSEHKGYLRVATNVTTWDALITTPSMSNHLFVLGDDSNGTLVVTGAVRDFGKGERIFSSRFLGTRGFVVTFRRVDPLFAFDLSDAAQPKLMGELTIPGFSTYIHPLGDNHLLTVGRAGDIGQMQLQIFDVTDLSKPALLHHYAPPGEYTGSSAEYDHHAFTFDASSNVLAIPFTSYERSMLRHFNGFASFKVDINVGFKEIVRVDHANLAQQAYCPMGTINDWLCVQNNYTWYAHPRRAMLMSRGTNQYLYTVSNVGIKATDLAPPYPTLGAVAFPDQVF